MAILRHLASSRCVSLPACTVVGREARNDLPLEHPKVSEPHARITYRPQHGVWVVRDLGSRNGTQRNDRGIQPGQDIVLEARERLRFGCDEQQWEVVNAGPPGPSAIGPKGQFVYALDGVLVLPDEAYPMWSIQLDGEHWTASREGSGAIVQVTDGQEMRVGDDAWRIYLPQQADGRPGTTVAVTADEHAHLSLFVVEASKDGTPSVELTVTVGGEVRVLKPRAHMRLLYRLAQERRAAAIDEEAWVLVNDLVLYLGLNTRHGLTVYKNRLKGSLRNCGFPLPEAVMGERHVGTEQYALQLSATVRFELIED